MDARGSPGRVGAGHLTEFGQCKFSKKESPDEGLPVMVVDEEIYRRLPSLLISTVDKFAQMPWNGATQMLFGQVEGLCERHGYRSPEIDDKNSHPRKNNGSPKVHVGHFASLTLGGGSSMLVSQSMIPPMSADAEWRQSLRIRPPAFRL